MFAKYVQMHIICINVGPDFQYITIWEETLAVEKFGKFAANLILAEENLANLPILKLKIAQRNSSVIF